MKYFILALALMFSFNASAISVTQELGATEIDVMDFTAFMEFPTENPLFGLISAGADPNAAMIIPLTFAAPSAPFAIPTSPITVTVNPPDMGGGFLMTTTAGVGILQSEAFEPVFFDGVDWNVASDAVASPGAVSFLFNPDPVFDAQLLQISGTQAGLVMADAQLEPPSAVPVPPAAWLFGSGLLGMLGVARRKT